MKYISTFLPLFYFIILFSSCTKKPNKPNTNLDKNDISLNVENPGASGFAAWWRLQHTRGYKPFVTKVWIKATIKGNLNN